MIIGLIVLDFFGAIVLARAAFARRDRPVAEATCQVNPDVRTAAVRAIGAPATSDRLWPAGVRTVIATLVDASCDTDTHQSYLCYYWRSQH
jgi:hypothetical protein